MLAPATRSGTESTEGRRCGTGSSNNGAAAWRRGSPRRRERQGEHGALIELTPHRELAAHRPPQVTADPESQTDSPRHWGCPALPPQQGTPLPEPQPASLVEQHRAPHLPEGADHLCQTPARGPGSGDGGGDPDVCRLLTRIAGHTHVTSLGSEL